MIFNKYSIYVIKRAFLCYMAMQFGYMRVHFGYMGLQFWLYARAFLVIYMIATLINLPSNQMTKIYLSVI